MAPPAASRHDPYSHLHPGRGLHSEPDGPRPGRQWHPTRANYITVSYTATHRVISYTYDSLYRLTDADYSTGEFYQYAYDAVGNRVETTRRIVSTAPAETITYQYDDANRLTSVNGVVYTWDNNGNPSTGSGQACSRTAAAPTITTTPIASPRS